MFVRPVSTPRRAFMIGCGRSGTTVLGKILGAHPEVTYFYEPQGRWAMVDPRADIWRRFYPKRAGGLLDEANVSHRNAQKFERLFRANTPFVVDKTPELVFRLDYQLTLTPEAKYIHIVRDGEDVANSIALRAQRSFQVWGDHRYNDWWGFDDGKWQFLISVADTRSYLADAAHDAQNDFDRGLCEWLLGIEEIERHRERLGGQLLEIRYTDLLDNTRDSIVSIAEFLGLTDDDDWLVRAAAIVRPERSRVYGSDSAILSEELRAELERVRANYGTR